MHDLGKILSRTSMIMARLVPWQDLAVIFPELARSYKILQRSSLWDMFPCFVSSFPFSCLAHSQSAFLLHPHFPFALSFLSLLFSFPSSFFFFLSVTFSFFSFLFFYFHSSSIIFPDLKTFLLLSHGIFCFNEVGKNL